MDNFSYLLNIICDLAKKLYGNDKQRFEIFLKLYNINYNEKLDCWEEKR